MEKIYDLELSVIEKVAQHDLVSFDFDNSGCVLSICEGCTVRSLFQCRSHIYDR